MSQIFHGRIKEMVRGSDLSTLSSKKIREQLEQEFKTDLSKRKKEIDDIVMSLLGALDSQSDQTRDSSDNDDDDDEVEENSTSVQSKKRKPKSSSKSTPTKAKKSKSHDSSKDEELARMLQEEEGGRRTRRTTHKEPKPKKKPAKREKTGNSTFKREMVLSPELADIMGTDKMSTAQVVQRMWQIVKERDLRDPSNKQFHICDEQLLKVFGTRRVRTFSMMKYLKVHVKDPELLTNS